MNTAAVTAARRYGSRDGFDLITFKEVGLPVYRLNTSAIVMAEKPVPAMQEFVLRAVETGMDTAESATAFLGLQEGDLDDAIFTLVAAGLIKVRHELANGVDRLELTPAGTEVTLSFRLSQAEERTYVIDFDGLLRVPVRHRGWALRPQALRDTGAMEITPSPPRRPSVDQIGVDKAEAALRESRSLDKSRKLLDLTRVNRADTLFIPATMLVFKARIGDEVQVGFVVDERPSEEHDDAFAAALGPEGLSLLASDGGLEAAAEEVLGGDVGRSALAIALMESAPDDLPEDVSEPVVAEPAAPLQPDYEMLETYDHPAYLERALERSEAQLVIVSPWIKSRVVDDAFVGRLRELLRRDVAIYIGYGFGEPGNQDDYPAVRALTRLAEESEKFTFCRFGDTHAKVLISDASYAIVTSFNWLSFLGDPRRTFRDERGMLVRDAAAVQDSTERVLARFESQGG